jgi:hypothetical protein
MNIKCLLGFHDWIFDREHYAFKCERCGKTKVTPTLALLCFFKDMLEINMKADTILALLMAGRNEEAKAKLEEWKREVEG